MVRKLNSLIDSFVYAVRYGDVDELPAELIDGLKDVIFNAICDASSKPEIKVEKDWDDEAPELDSFLTDLTVMEAK